MTMSPCLDVHRFAPPYCHSRSLRIRDFWSQRDDLHEVFFAQFPRHWAENPGPPGLLSSSDDDRSIFVKANIGTVLRRTPRTERTTTALTMSPFLTTPPGVACFHRTDDDIADVGHLLARITDTRMHMSSLAPELSATFNLVCCLITTYPPFSPLVSAERRLHDRFFYNFYQAPALLLGQRPCLHDAHQIAYFGLVVFSCALYFLVYLIRLPYSGCLL